MLERGKRELAEKERAQKGRDRNEKGTRVRLHSTHGNLRQWPAINVINGHESLTILILLLQSEQQSVPSPAVDLLPLFFPLNTSTTVCLFLSSSSCFPEGDAFHIFENLVRGINLGITLGIARNCVLDILTLMVIDY